MVFASLLPLRFRRLRYALKIVPPNNAYVFKDSTDYDACVFGVDTHETRYITTDKRLINITIIPMTKQEALDAMLAGNKVTHFKFEDNKYMFINKDGHVEFSDGTVISAVDFFLNEYKSVQDGYSIVE